MLRCWDIHRFMLRHHMLVCCDICILRCWDMSALQLLKHSQVDIHMLRCWDIHTLMCQDVQRWDIHRLTQGYIPRSRCWDFHMLIYRDTHSTWWDSPMLRCWDIHRLRCKGLLIHLSDFKHQMTWARPEIQTWALFTTFWWTLLHSSLQQYWSHSLEASTGSFHPCLCMPCIFLPEDAIWAQSVCTCMGRQETLWINLCG